MAPLIRQEHAVQKSHSKLGMDANDGRAGLLACQSPALADGNQTTSRSAHRPSETKNAAVSQKLPVDLHRELQ
jgi:hypothetical protein